ncbi:MAG: hypothetical protein J6X55_12945, partial [Victivallales bacterium]|nr:hypothetical protein [Victivallales bacterium]
LKKYVEQQNNDKAFDEMNALLVENTVPRSEVFAAIAPIIEDILKTERTNKFAEDDAIWSSTVEQVKKEIKELKAKEEAEKEEQRKKQEEEERAEKERKRLEERANAIKEEKLRRIAKLHENAEKNKLPSSILDFQIHFDDEDADLQKWRESWKGYIEKSSELMDAVSSFHVDEEQKKSNITLPVVIHYKSKKDATNEIDNYTTALMTLVKFDGEKATFEATKGMILQKMPDIQSRKFKSLPENLISFTVDFELLLPEQQIAITKAALAAAKESEGTDAATLVASSLISKGNFLHDIFENPVFEDFRSANDFVETLKAEQEYDANDELMAKHVKMLSQLLDECEKAPKALKTHIAETTIQRYLSSLSKSNATDELKEFMARYTKFANRN